ncbi:hypothetical protein ACFE04_015606 [Oxalis oulophora]
MPSIVLVVPCFRKYFRKKALLSQIMEVIHDEEEAYSPSTHDDFLEVPSFIGIEGSYFIGFTTSSSYIDSVLILMDVSRNTPSVPSLLPLLVSSQTIISTTTTNTSTNTSSELPKALVSTSQLSSSCATALTTTMSISHELLNTSLSLPPLSSFCTIASSTTLTTSSEPPNMPLSLSLLIFPPLSSLCTIVSSTTLSALSELPSMSHSLPSMTSLCTIAPLMTSENIISSLDSAYLSSYVPLIAILTQSTAIF